MMGHRRSGWGRIALVAGALVLVAAWLPLALWAEGSPEQLKGLEVVQSTCGQCHGSTPKYPLQGARLGYETSGHANNGNSYYANGGGCQRCHTNEGFIQYVQTGKDDTAGYVAYPSQPGCFTCHAPHEKGDMSLRTVAPVKLQTGTVYDTGSGNLCASCHQARVVAAKAVVASNASAVRSSWGPHHGPQADVVSGTNAYEFAGKSYSSSVHGSVVENGCVTCHAALPAGRYGFSPQLGGHSFALAGEVHESELLNVSSCTACHPKIGQVAAGGAVYYNIAAKADYDRDGAVEPVQAEVQGLLDKFVNEKGTGYLQTMNPPMYKKTAKAVFADAGGGWAGSQQGQWGVPQMAALYNYRFILEDRSLGVHNTTYTVQILYDSLKALDSSFDVSLRPR